MFNFSSWDLGISLGLMDSLQELSTPSELMPLDALSPHLDDLKLSPLPWPDLDEEAPVPVARHSIGGLTCEERRAKIKKYLEKKPRRIYGKRISYSCRKRVADNRVRVKGRFVKKAEARPE